MSGRYKDDTFHMLETFNKTAKRQTGFGLSSQNKLAGTRGKIGDTWDAQHMTSFLNESHYSSWSKGETKDAYPQNYNHNRHNSTHDHFFRTTKDNKNVSKFGYTQVNPLVSLPEVSLHRSQVLKEFLEKESPERYASPRPTLMQDGKFMYQGNSVKFRATDPLTQKYVSQKNPSNFQKQRMRFLIAKRHPHGITGIDHSQSPTLGLFKNQTMDIRIRQQPNSHQTHILDRDWKSKGKVSAEYKQEYGFPKANFIQERKFRNDDTHGYNIVTNRKSPE